jgi:type IV pilus assembly protein PilO
MNISDLLDKFNFKNLHEKPLVQQLLILILCSILAITLFVGLVIYPQIEALNVLEEEEKTLKADFSKKVVEVKNLALLEKQLETIEKNMLLLGKNLPTKAEMDAILADLSRSDFSNGWVFQNFKIEPIEVRKEMVVLPISVKVRGTYRQLVNFTQDVGNLPRIVTLSDIEVQPIGDSAKKLEEPVLLLTATAKAYRQLASDEKFNASQEVAKP